MFLFKGIAFWRKFYKVENIERKEKYIYIQGFDGKLERGKWNREEKKLRWRKNYDS